MVPLLLMLPVKFFTPLTTSAVPLTAMSPLLLILPEMKFVTLATTMPAPLPTIVPLLLMPPAKVDTEGWNGFDPPTRMPA